MSERKPAKLRHLRVTRVDLVDRGACQDADIVFFKRAREPDSKTQPPASAAGGERSEPMNKNAEGWLGRMLSAIAKKIGLTDEDVAKTEPMTVTEVLNHDKAMSEFWNLKWALSRSLETIMDSEEAADRKAELMQQAIQEFADKAKELQPHLEMEDEMSKAVAKFLGDLTTAKDSGPDQVMSIVKALQPPAAGSDHKPTVKKKESEPIVNLEDIIKSLPEDQRKVLEAALSKPAPPTPLPEDVTKRIEAAEKAATQATAKVEELAKRADDAEQRAKDAEAKLIAEVEKRVSAEYLDRARKYPTAGQPEEVAAKLRKAYDAGEEIGKELEASYTKAEQAIEKARLFESIGKPGGGPAAGSAAEKIEKMAKERAAASNGAVSFEKAYDQILQENRELYRELRAEK